MFLCRTEWGTYGPGPIFYALAPVPKRLKRYVEHYDPWYLSQTDGLNRIFPHGRFNRTREQLKDRTRFVQLASKLEWTGLSCDLSVEVLTQASDTIDNHSPVLDLRVLQQMIEMRWIDWNDSHREYRQNCYLSLLSAYFSVTTDLDMLARSEIDCSSSARQLIAERIAEYADPTRELLMKMVVAQISGEFSGEVFVGRFKRQIEELTAPWNPSTVALEASDTYVTQQSDHRIQSFLALRELGTATQN